MPFVADSTRLFPRPTHCVLATLLSLLISLVADAEGVFLYTTYFPLWLLALGAVFAVRRVFGRSATPMRTIQQIAVVASALTLAVSALLLPQLRTSARKGFYLDVASLHVGQHLTEVREILRPYEPSWQQGSHINYSYRSGPATEDHAIIEVDDSGRLATDIRFSLD